MKLRLERHAVLAWALALAPLVVCPTADAQTIKILHAFTGGFDGGAPWGTPLVSGGITYATTTYGGGASSSQVGTVYEVTSFGTAATYYVFAGQPYDGAVPMSGLVADPYGDFFGVTTQGGFNQRGTLYEISAGSEFVLHNFSGPDGQNPEGGLIMDAAGNLYGTATNGGANGCGTVFAASSFGGLATLYSFGNSRRDGIGPASGLVLQKGVLYGTTTEGGDHGWGTVFSLNIKTKAETVLYSFRGGPDGGTPVGSLVADGNGNLYGTASVGGASNGNKGQGLIFKLNIKSLRFSKVHTFTGLDGAQPTAGMIADGQGNYYGTTYIGGANGYGTVFRLDSAGVFTTLYSFTNGTDGSHPYAGVTLDPAGNLYGAATGGGQYGWGTMFEITP